MSPLPPRFTVSIALLILAVTASGFSAFSSSPRGRSNLVSIEGPSASEKELWDEINLLRADPPKYAEFLVTSKKYYTGKRYKPPGQAKFLVTMEGIAAADEAIAALRATKPLPPYSLSNGMCLAAKDHVADMIRTGISGHRGTDGSTPDMRVNRYGKFTGGIGESINYQAGPARETVMGWIVDDGVPSRGHRANLLAMKYHVVGVSIETTAKTGTMCVMTLAGEYVEANAGIKTKRK